MIFLFFSTCFLKEIEIIFCVSTKLEKIFVKVWVTFLPNVPLTVYTSNLKVNTVAVFGYLILISKDFYNFTSLFSP